MSKAVLNEKIRDFEVALVEIGPFSWELFVWYHSEMGFNAKVYGENLTAEATARDTFTTVCNYLRAGGFEITFKVSDWI